MWAKITFFTSVFLAVLVVVLLALLSPTPHGKDRTNPSLDLSLYIQHPPHDTARHAAPAEAGALVFHRLLTEGPESTSRVVGKAQGFIIPIEHFAYSDFNVVYLSFDAPEYSGSLGVRAGHEEALTVVGGTGSFAFARGQAVFAKAGGAYHVKLQLRFPNASRTIPG